MLAELINRPDETAQFKRIMIPLVRRVYPQLITDKIISIQPLPEPTFLRFYKNRNRERDIPKANWLKQGF